LNALYVGAGEFAVVVFIGTVVVNLIMKNNVLVEKLSF